MLTGRFTNRIYCAYSTVYCLGTILSMQIAFVGFQPIQSSEHMGALGVFGLCQLLAFYNYTKARLTSEQFDVLFKTAVMCLGGAGLVAGTILTISGSNFKKRKLRYLFILHY